MLTKKAAPPFLKAIQRVGSQIGTKIPNAFSSGYLKFFCVVMEILIQQNLVLFLFYRITLISLNYTLIVTFVKGSTKNNEATRSLLIFRPSVYAQARSIPLIIVLSPIFII